MLGYTVWLVAATPLAQAGLVRNTRHTDMFCPYDCRDGWEVQDSRTGAWLQDTELTVTCVPPPTS